MPPWKGPTLRTGLFGGSFLGLGSSTFGVCSVATVDMTVLLSSDEKDRSQVLAVTTARGGLCTSLVKKARVCLRSARLILLGHSCAVLAKGTAASGMVVTLAVSHRAGCDNTGRFMSNSRYINHLVADGHTMSCLEEFAQIAFELVMREPGHGDCPVPAGKG